MSELYMVSSDKINTTQQLNVFYLHKNNLQHYWSNKISERNKSTKLILQNFAYLKLIFWLFQYLFINLNIWIEDKYLEL